LNALGIGAGLKQNFPRFFGKGADYGCQNFFKGLLLKIFGMGKELPHTEEGKFAGNVTGLHEFTKKIGA
jgi:hypothetical protein